MSKRGVQKWIFFLLTTTKSQSDSANLVGQEVIFQFRNRTPVFPGAKWHIFKILKSDLQFLRYVKLRIFPVWQCLSRLYIYLYITAQKNLILLEKINRTWKCNTIACRCQLRPKYSFFVKFEVTYYILDALLKTPLDFPFKIFGEGGGDFPLFRNSVGEIFLSIFSV